MIIIECMLPLNSALGDRSRKGSRTGKAVLAAVHDAEVLPDVPKNVAQFTWQPVVDASRVYEQTDSSHTFEKPELNCFPALASKNGLIKYTSPNLRRNRSNVFAY